MFQYFLCPPGSRFAARRSGFHSVGPSAVGRAVGRAFGLALLAPFLVSLFVFRFGRMGRSLAASFLPAARLLAPGCCPVAALLVPPPPNDSAVWWGALEIPSSPPLLHRSRLPPWLGLCFFCLPFPACSQAGWSLRGHWPGPELFVLAPNENFLCATN